MTSFMPNNPAPQPQNPYYARKRMPSAHTGRQARTEAGLTLTPLHRYRRQRAEQYAQQAADSTDVQSPQSAPSPVAPNAKPALIPSPLGLRAPREHLRPGASGAKKLASVRARHAKAAQAKAQSASQSAQPAPITPRFSSSAPDTQSQQIQRIQTLCSGLSVAFFEYLQGSRAFTHLASWCTPECGEQMRRYRSRSEHSIDSRGAVRVHRIHVCRAAGARFEVLLWVTVGTRAIMVAMQMTRQNHRMVISAFEYA